MKIRRRKEIAFPLNSSLIERGEERIPEEGQRGTRGRRTKSRGGDYAHPRRADEIAAVEEGEGEGREGRSEGERALRAPPLLLLLLLLVVIQSPLLSSHKYFPDFSSAPRLHRISTRPNSAAEEKTAKSSTETAFLTIFWRRAKVPGGSRTATAAASSFCGQREEEVESKMWGRNIGPLEDGRHTRGGESLRAGLA